MPKILFFCFVVSMSLIVGISAQSNVITKEASDYMMKIENLETHLHVQVLYQIEEGIRRCERDVDGEYIERNLPFIIDLEMLFIIFLNEKDYKIKGQGELIELTTYQIVGGRTYSQVSEMMLEEVQILEGRLKKTTNPPSETKQEIKTELKEELMKEVKDEIQGQMKEYKEKLNQEIRREIQKFRTDVEREVMIGVNQRLEVIVNETRSIQNSLELLKSQSLGKFVEIQKIVSDLQLMVKENQNKIEIQLKRISSQQKQNSNAKEIQVLKNLLQNLEERTQKTQGKVGENNASISSLRRELQQINRQIRSILQTVQIQAQKIQLFEKTQTESQIPPQSVEVKNNKKQNLPTSQPSLQSSQAYEPSGKFWRIEYPFTFYFRLSGRSAVYVGQHNKPTQLVLNYKITLNINMVFRCKYSQNSGLINFGVLNRKYRWENQSSCESSLCIGKNTGPNGGTFRFRIFVTKNYLVYLIEIDSNGRIIQSKKQYQKNFIKQLSPFIQMNKPGDKVQCWEE